MGVRTWPVNRLLMTTAGATGTLGAVTALSAAMAGPGRGLAAGCGAVQLVVAGAVAFAAGRDPGAAGGAVAAPSEQVSAAAATLDGLRRQMATATGELDDVLASVGTTAKGTSDLLNAMERNADTVARNIQVIASGSTQMESAISQISSNAHDAAQVAGGAVAAMESTTVTMSKLGDSSREIGDVIRLITSIAEQTNLLALNATIEAARAGDAGKGFAVVADEVKQLARETARATDDISRRVETIQQDADLATRAISEVAGVIAKMNEFQATIAGAVEEQSATTRAINEGVNQVAEGSGQIARSVTGRADAAGQAVESTAQARQRVRELAGLSEQLAGVVRNLQTQN